MSFTVSVSTAGGPCLVRYAPGSLVVGRMTQHEARFWSVTSSSSLLLDLQHQVCTGKAKIIAVSKKPKASMTAGKL